MKKVSVYRTSAEDIFNKKARYCCEAIWNNTSDYLNLIDNFSSLFKPLYTESKMLWFGENAEENREHRILSLLLMGEVYNQNSVTKESDAKSVTKPKIMTISERNELEKLKRCEIYERAAEEVQSRRTTEFFMILNKAADYDSRIMSCFYGLFGPSEENGYQDFRDYEHAITALLLMAEISMDENYYEKS